MQRIGLVGHGPLARIHANRYADIEEATVAAVAPSDFPGTYEQANESGAAVYDDAEALCNNADVDAIDVATPPDTHRALIETAAERGFGVFCEAPVARTSADAAAIADTVQDHGITFVPGLTARFSPAYRTAKDRVEDGVVGGTGTVRTFRLEPLGTGTRHDAGTDSDAVLVETASPDFDFLRWLVGEVERVFSRQASWDGNEHAFTTVRFADDTVGHVEARLSADAGRAPATRFELAGTDGSIEFDSETADPVRIDGASESVPEQSSGPGPRVADPYRPALEHFVACLATGQEPAVTVDDAIEALRVSLAAVESARTGEPVTPAEVVA